MFGGFDLSNKAIKRLLELMGKECYFYKQTKFHFECGENQYTRCDETDNGILVLVSTKDLGKKIDKNPNEDYFYYGNLERTNPCLIQTIEELGEEASGRFGNVQIVDIPDDIEWTISDYDGLETVEEVHRSW
jgi:hypothetical protein